MSKKNKKNEKQAELLGNNSGQKDFAQEKLEQKKLEEEQFADDDKAISTDKVKDKNISVIRLIAAGLIMTSVILFSLPFINAALIKRYSKVNLSSITAQDMAENAKEIKDVNHDIIEEIGVFNIWPWLNKYDIKSIVGELSIPKLGIDLAVFNDPSNENLLAGVCYLKKDQELGKWNFAVSGHRAKGRGVLLHNLMEADIGDRVNLSDKKNIYVYKIIDTLQTEVDAVELIEDSMCEKYDNKPIISIMTCYFGKSSSRWFVIGKLVKVVPYSASEMQNDSI